MHYGKQTDSTVRDPVHDRKDIAHPLVKCLRCSWPSTAHMQYGPYSPEVEL
jgi:hypothetical protein